MDSSEKSVEGENLVTASTTITSTTKRTTEDFYIHDTTEATNGQHSTIWLDDRSLKRSKKDQNAQGNNNLGKTNRFGWVDEKRLDKTIGVEGGAQKN
jgi:hypothetical protein